MIEEPTTIERAYRVRLKLKPAQVRLLNRLLGAKRFTWNWALRRKKEAFEADGTKLGWAELSREFTVLRSAPDTAWLATLSREPFNQVLRDFDRGWKNFFAGRARRPRRKKYGTVSSVRFTLDQRRIETIVDRARGTVHLPGLGILRFRLSEPLLGRLRSVTISKDAAGRWHACFTADGVPRPQRTEAPAASLGIDLGLKATATLSTGEVISNARPLAAKLKRLRRYQRRYVRQRDAAARRQGLDPGKPFPKGTRIEVSNRMRRTQRRIGKLHAKVADVRRNHLHQVSARAIASAEVIAIEDLNVKGMARGMGRRAFRRSVGDAGLGELRRQLTYKAAWQGRVVVAVDRFYPSSKTCGACGHVHAGLRLQDRAWACPACGEQHDRDINAAKNVEAEGLRLLSTPGNGGIHAQGEAACATGRSAPVGQPTSLNCELTYRVAKPRSPAARRPERREAGVG